MTARQAGAVNSLTSSTGSQHLNKVSRTGPVMVTRFSQKSRFSDKATATRQVQGQTRKLSQQVSDKTRSGDSKQDQPQSSDSQTSPQR